MLQGLRALSSAGPEQLGQLPLDWDCKDEYSFHRKEKEDKGILGSD